MDLSLLTISLLLIFTSFVLKYTSKDKWSLIILTIAAFVLRYMMAGLDPFLHEWDERYHALVARNLMNNPLKSMLLANPPLDYDFHDWGYNHIWLHKQPLFLWQMALSMKIFGVSEFTMRLPSVVLGALTIPLTYRIAQLYSQNKYLPYGAAVFMCLSGYQLELISGYWGMDHNDVSFCFWVLSSIWAYFEYNRTKKWYWAILVGIFSGGAILNKWLTGLLVYSGWGINTLLLIRKKEFSKEILSMVLSLVVCLLVFLPWQVYIFKTFPKEAAYEFAFNTKHIFEVVEGHNGHNEFYLNKFYLFFGDYIWILTIIGFVLSFFKKKLNKERIAIATYMSVVYVFFSLIVITKIPSYFFIAVPFGFIYISTALYWLQGLISNTQISKLVFLSLIAISSYWIFSPEEINKHHNEQDHYRIVRINNANIYRNLKNYIPDTVKVVMNTNAHENIDIMFYNNDISAYHYCLSDDLFDIMIKPHSIPIAVFDSRLGYILPYHVISYEHTSYICSDLMAPADYRR